LTDYVKVDARVICATRRDLEAAIQEHRLRDDLCHRLVVAHIEVPPLRNRTGDVELLADYWGELGGGSMPPGFRERLRASLAQQRSRAPQRRGPHDRVG